MRTQWDVIVVGASFAGAACALAAREYGLRVCVLERKRDPGIKLHTTGIIVREAAEHLPAIDHLVITPDLVQGLLSKLTVDIESKG